MNNDYSYNFILNNNLTYHQHNSDDKLRKLFRTSLQFIKKSCNNYSPFNNHAAISNNKRHFDNLSLNEKAIFFSMPQANPNLSLCHKSYYHERNRTNINAIYKYLHNKTSKSPKNYSALDDESDKKIAQKLSFSHEDRNNFSAAFSINNSYASLNRDYRPEVSLAEESFY